jgi:ribosomal protein S18 acetylase RimI-like enzyme
VETQNTNYPAIQFYQRYGFKLCGLDERLYDPATQSIEETALFFALDLQERPDERVSASALEPKL